MSYEARKPCGHTWRIALLTDGVKPSPWRSQPHPAKSASASAWQGTMMPQHSNYIVGQLWRRSTSLRAGLAFPDAGSL